MKKISILLAFAFAVASTSAFAADFGKHPHLKKAHNQIENAKKSLQEANDKEKSEFGGHREKAEQLLDQAQHEIEEAAEWANSHK